MNPKAVIRFCAALAGAGAVVAVLSELNHQSGSNSLPWVMISRFVLVMAFAVFGMYAAQQGRLRGSVLVTSTEAGSTFQDLVNYGILPGFILGLINYLFFFDYRYEPDVAPRIRAIESAYDSFLISLDSGILEEVVFRLFIMSSLLFLFQHLYQQLRPVWPQLVSIIPQAMALVLSSLLFALAHNVYGFTGAFSGGLMLGFIYLKSGVESAIAAHFVANFLFFSASYLP